MPSGASCETEGYIGGTLGCLADHTFDTETCLEAAIDREGIAISTEGVPGPPSISTIADNSLIVWHDDRNGDDDIHGARFASDGQVMDEDGVELAVADDWQRSPGVACSDDKCLVAWLDRRDGQHARAGGAVVNAKAEVLSSATIDVAPANKSYDVEGIAVGAAEAGYLLVWCEPGGVKAVAIDADGEVIGDEAIAVKDGQCSMQSPPAVTRSGNAYLVVWEFLGFFGGGALVEGSGKVSPVAGLDIESRPSVANDGTSNLVAWAAEGVIGARQVSNGGTLTGNKLIIHRCGRSCRDPVVASDGRGFLVVWSEHDDESERSGEILAARVGAGGAVSKRRVLIADGQGPHPAPAVAFDGRQYVVTWTDSRAGTPRILVARVKASEQ
jgi:hypothetical protein